MVNQVGENDWRFVRKQTPEFERQWRLITILTRQLEDEWNAVYDRATEELRAKITVDDLTAALEVGDGERVLQGTAVEEPYRIALLGLSAPIRAIFDRAGSAELLRLNLGLRFDLQNPYAIQWIQRHTADLVTTVTEETKRAIRQVVLDAFEQGLPARQAAMRIRPLVGLTARDSRAALRYWRTLNEEGDMTARRANELADTYAARLHRQRALTIARTEAVSASNAGVQESWQQAQQAGLVDPETRQEWIAAVESSRTCPACLELDGQRVPLGQPFRSSVYGPVYRPTAHPQCRCALGLVTEIPK